MKRSFCVALVLALSLSGCGKAPTPATDDKSKPAPAAPSDAPSAAAAPVAFAPDTRGLVSPEEVPLLEQINRENTRVSAAALPSIVRISVTHTEDPRMELFGRELPFPFSVKPGQRHPALQGDTSFGSGVIIDKGGLIVTNNHVVEEAKEIEVQLADKRSFPARLVAADEMVDVAVLKIDAAGDLQPLPWGDSDKVQVGEQVFAIGNPYDFDDSVSKGIVSAKGRNMPGTTNYEDYIQTDAAVNPGNSGGALINIYGQLVGINTAIASNYRFGVGVGFAIPSNLVRYSVEGLLKDGRIVRGYLGVILPASVDDGVLGQLGLDNQQGALLAGVPADSPAGMAGLKGGDFITDVGGHKIGDTADLRLVVAQLPIGQDVEVKFIRDGQPKTVMVKITAVPSEVQAAMNPVGNDGQPATPAKPLSAVTDNVLAGIEVADLDDKSREKYGVAKMVTSGVVVTAIDPDSPSAEKITKGDVIESLSVNKGSTQQLGGARDFADVVQKVKPDQSVVLLVHHVKASSFIFLSPPK
jgi:serine protease Do